MKKACGIIMGLAILLAGLWMNPKQVQADIIALPEDNFWYSHYEELIMFRYTKYTASGPDGEVIVYKSPADAGVVTKLENGTIFKGMYAYEDEDGIFWILYENRESDVNGWIPHDYLTGEYNLISFLKEFKDQIIEEKWEPDSSIIGKDAYYWDYPGSTEGFRGMFTKSSACSEIYVDEVGRRWGHTESKSWICLDAPEADFEALYPNGAPERGTEQVQESAADGDWIVPSGFAWYDIAGVGVLIVAVIGITLWLLKKLK